MSRYYHSPYSDDTLMPNMYWHNEQLIYNETTLDAIDKAYAVDTMATHTSPSFCELTSHFAAWGIGLYE